MRAIFSLLSNILITGSSIIGCATIINKLGKFFKTIEDESKGDNFKIAFDNLMMDSIDDMNRCVESISTIASNINNATIIVYDIIIGNKFIKKDKDGKIIICSKSKLYSGYKDKIDELSGKVKKYQEELRKIKKKPNNDIDQKIPSKNKNNNDESDISDDDNDDSTVSSDSNTSTVSAFSLDGDSSVSSDKSD